jgi:dienelactone hydrolase
MVARAFACLFVLLMAVNSSKSKAGPTLNQLVEINDVDSLAIAPNGKSIAFRVIKPSVERNKVELTWYVIPLMSKLGTVPTLLSDGGMAIFDDAGVLKNEHAVWSADSQWIYFRRAVAGAVQVWRVSGDGERREQVTELGADVDQFGIVNAGRTLVAEHGPRRADIAIAEQSLYLNGVPFDKSIDPGQALLWGGNINGRRATERLHGDWFDRWGLLGEKPREFTSFDTSSRVAIPSTDQEIAAFHSSHLTSKFEDLTSTFATTSMDGNWTATLSQSGATSSIQIVRNHSSQIVIECPRSICGNGYVASLAWRDERNELIAFVSNKSKGTSIFLWQPQARRVKRLLTTSGRIFGDLQASSSCPSRGDWMYCVFADMVTPPALTAVDLRLGTIATVYAPNTGIVAPHASKLTWRDAAGSVFSGVYFRASGPKPASGFPLFINYYNCGGYLRGGVGNEYPFSALADRGVAALCINKRSSASTSQEYDATQDYQIGMNGITAIVEQLARRGEIDDNRVGMGGLSFAAEVTAWVAMKSKMLAAASISSGLIEPEYYWLNIARNSAMRSNFVKWWKLDAPDTTPERWKAISPALNTDSILAPVLFQLSEQEYRYNLELFGRLEAHDRCATMYIYPDEAHIKSQPKHKLAVYQRNVAWFEYWLKLAPGGTRPADAVKRCNIARKLLESEHFPSSNQN